jgi:hypothetical protein
VVEAYNGSSAHPYWTEKIRGLDKCSCRVDIFCGLEANKKSFVVVFTDHSYALIYSFNKGEYPTGRQGLAIEKNLDASCREGASLDIKASKCLDMRSEYVAISTEARSCS